MCQLTFVNLHKESLNKRLLLLLTSIGSTVHGDGFGVISCATGGTWKTSLPAWMVENAGEIMGEELKGDDAIIAHIRKASPRIPVTMENAHPFSKDDVVIIHNGGLTPKDEDKFEMDYEVEEVNDKGVTIKKKMRRSDTLFYFEEFLRLWTPEKKWDDALREAMNSFYGKFAFMLYIKGQPVIIRGKTADLHISYLLSKKGGKPIGYAINTEGKLLDLATTMLSNLNQIDGGTPLHFTLPELLDAETIYIPQKTGLKKAGEMKENPAPVKYYAPFTSSKWERGAGGANFTQKSGETSGKENLQTKASENAIKYARITHEFQVSHALHVRDIMYLLLAFYGASSKDLDEKITAHFCNIVIPRLKNMTKKEIRRRIKKACKGFPVGGKVYWDKGFGAGFPWMVNSEAIQQKIAAELEK